VRWREAQARLSVGQRVRGEVIARAPFGVWVDIHAGRPALLLVPDMAGARQHAIREDEYPALGTVLDAWIRRLGDDAKIVLSQHPDLLEYATPDDR